MKVLKLGLDLVILKNWRGSKSVHFTVRFLRRATAGGEMKYKCDVAHVKENLMAYLSFVRVKQHPICIFFLGVNTMQIINVNNSFFVSSMAKLRGRGWEVHLPQGTKCGRKAIICR